MVLMSAAVTESNLIVLQESIAARDDAKGEAPVRRSFARMRTSDPEPEVDPLDPPTVETRPIRVDVRTGE
jgi:hypothetical protein